MRRTGTSVVVIMAVLIGLVLCEPVRDWLTRPWDGSLDHRIAAWAAWHGRLMVLGWAILSPVGVLVARYGKIWRGQDWPRQLDNKNWWHIHRVLQISGVLLATLGLLLSLEGAIGHTALALAHAMAGWTIMAFGWLQIAAAFVRGSKGGPTDRRAMRGDHFDMTRRRIVFEYVHKFGGYAALALVLVAVPLGLALANAPRWMWLVIGLWWSGLATVSIALQRRGHCVDTYQAIWGADPALPGNQIRPIGLGVSRRLPEPPLRN